MTSPPTTITVAPSHHARHNAWELLSAQVQRGHWPGLRCLRVLAVCGSTQDEAHLAWSALHTEADATPDALVVASLVQSRGRGRLGRVWEQVERGSTPRAGLAVTIAMLAPRTEDSLLALRAGIAALWACQACSTRPESVGLRWPNDVVVCSDDDTPGALVGRKLAGVLIERREHLVLVGVGINVAHGPLDFPAPLDQSAASLAMLGLAPALLDDPDPRPVALAHLLDAFTRAGALDAQGLARVWQDADTLVGTRRRFVHDGHEHAGVIESIEPTSVIVLRTDAGALLHLPALTTSLVHER